MTSEELACRELVELVTDYLDAKLSSAERARFEVHLAECVKCRVYLDQMRQTIRVLGKLTEDNIAPPARADLLAAFRTWKRGMN